MDYEEMPKRNNRKKREKIIRQSNFYLLTNAVQHYRLPITVQVIPQKGLTIFENTELERIVLTVISHVNRVEVTCMVKNDIFPVNISDQSVHVVPIDDRDRFHTIKDLIEEQVKNVLDWFVVITAFKHGKTLYESGQIMQAKPLSNSKFGSLRRKRNILKVVLYPSLKMKSLPENITSEFRKCSSPDFKQPVRLLSEVINTEILPCLVRFPTKSNDAILDRFVNENILITEKRSKGISIVLKESNNGIKVHSIPSHINFEVEILHGELPITSLTSDQRLTIEEKLIYRDRERGENEHVKYEMHDLINTENVLRGSNLEEDVYTNCEEMFCLSSETDENVIDHDIPRSFLNSSKRLTTKSSTALNHIGNLDETVKVVCINKPLPPTPIEANDEDAINSLENPTVYDTSVCPLNNNVNNVEMDQAAPTEKRRFSKVNGEDAVEYLNLDDYIPINMAKKEQNEACFESTNGITFGAESKTSVTTEQETALGGLSVCAQYVDMKKPTSTEQPVTKKQPEKPKIPPKAIKLRKPVEPMIEDRPILPPRQSPESPMSYRSIWKDKNVSESYLDMANNKADILAGGKPQLPTENCTLRRMRHVELCSRNTSTERSSYYVNEWETEDQRKHYGSMSNYDYCEDTDMLAGVFDNAKDCEDGSASSIQQEASRGNISKLSISEVGNLLKVVSLQHKSKLFEVNDIDGELLIALDEDDLRSIGLTHFEARKLHRYINGWRSKKYPRCETISEFSVDALSDFLFSIKLHSLSRFCKKEDIDGRLMIYLLQDALLLTLEEEHDVLFKRFELVKLKKHILNGYVPKH